MTTDSTSGPAPEPPPIDGIGAGGAAVALTEEELQRQKRKRRILGAILAVLAIIIAILIYRALTGSPPLPGILAPDLPHYSRSIYGTARPMGVAVSPSGDRIYVTESDGKRLVRVFDNSGKQVDTLNPPGHAGQWRLPVYVAVNPMTGEVYVSDRLRQTIDIYKPDGEYRGKYKPRPRRLFKGIRPLGLAFDAQGNLYMTDVSGKSHRVLVFGPDRKLIRKLGKRRQFSFPNGIAVDSSGDTYVADSNHGQLEIFNAEGMLVASIRRGVGSGDLGLPRGVAISSDGRLYIVDTTNQNVKVYRLKKQGSDLPVFIGAFGQEGQGNGMFEYPNGVAVDSNGRIYVTDRENNRVQVWKK